MTFATLTMTMMTTTAMTAEVVVVVVAVASLRVALTTKGALIQNQSERARKINTQAFLVNTQIKILPARHLLAARNAYKQVKLPVRRYSALSELHS